MEKYQKESNVNIQELFSNQPDVKELENVPFVTEECGDTMWDVVLEQTICLNPKTK